MWEIQIDKPTVIVGDSNLGRILDFLYSNVQVDSFPGANSYHINSVFKKLQSNPMPEKIVLSVGLNNCLGRQTPTTSWKQLQQLLRTSKEAFPNATVYVPFIHYSD